MCRALYLFVCMLMTCVFMGLCIMVALPHSFYPHECCHDQDCAPVEKVELLSGPAMASMLAPSGLPSATLVTTKHGSVVIPQGFPRRQSPDGRAHACMRRGASGTMTLICYFEPPNS
jgi:hypothetical protein